MYFLTVTGLVFLLASSKSLAISTTNTSEIVPGTSMYIIPSVTYRTQIKKHSVSITY
nr:MAG TPA: hypothetical protein [Caudoviricetes sp.]